jgi:hypothetical protein
MGGIECVGDGSLTELIARLADRPEIVDEGAQLDKSLDLNDLGVSGYTGKNLLKGRFKAFLAAVDEGVVELRAIT